VDIDELDEATLNSSAVFQSFIFVAETINPWGSCKRQLHWQLVEMAALVEWCDLWSSPRTRHEGYRSTLQVGSIPGELVQIFFIQIVLWRICLCRLHKQKKHEKNI
jgi:hypothetical protein